MTDGYAVEASVPPPNIKEKGRKSKYPINEMNPGESFAFDPDSVRAIRSAVSRAQSRWKGEHRLYSVRPDPMDARKYRCWRIR
jgi:hypothetical protein